MDEDLPLPALAKLVIFRCACCGDIMYLPYATSTESGQTEYYCRFCCMPNG